MSKFVAIDGATTDEASVLLHIKRETVYMWLRVGKLTGRKVGKKWLIDRDAINRVLAGDAA